MGKDKIKTHKINMEGMEILETGEDIIRPESNMTSPFLDEEPIVITEKAGWEINADIDPDLKKAGLDFLNKGMHSRKVAIHCGITIDKIKRI